MLTAERVSNMERVIGRDSAKNESPFQCPKCKREVVLRKGNRKIHHFAHKPPITCNWGAGETEAHRTTCLAIYDALRLAAGVEGVALEKDFGSCVADVFAVIRGERVAVEVQRSKISAHEIARRTVNYHALNIAVLWVLLPREELSTDKLSAKEFEKWCHAAWYGRAYYWIAGEVLQPVHFDEYLRWVEATSWYADGMEQSAGGYSLRSKRWVTPRPGTPVRISQDFERRCRRDAWTSKHMVIPACTLWMDRLPPWWETRKGPESNPSHRPVMSSVVRRVS